MESDAHGRWCFKLTWVILGAKTIATFRAFILLRCSSWAISAIKLMAQSRRAAWVGGRSLTSRAHSSSDWHCITCSGLRESNTPAGSSLNQAYIREHRKHKDSTTNDKTQLIDMTSQQFRAAAIWTLRWYSIKRLEYISGLLLHRFPNSWNAALHKFLKMFSI